MKPDGRPGSTLLALLAAWLVLMLMASALPARGAPGDILPQDFEQGLGAWVVLGDGAELSRVTDAAWVHAGRAAMAYRYQVGKGRIHMLVLPVTPGSLGKARSLAFAVKPSQLLSLAVSLEEQGGGRWTAPITVTPGQWTEVVLGLDDFALATGNDDPPDPNGRLDIDRVRQVAVVDLGAMLASGSADTARMFGISTGERRLAIDDLSFSAAAGPAAPAGTATSRRLDRFDSPLVRGMVFGAAQVSPGRTAPLTQPGLALTYRKAPGAVLSWLQPVAEGALANARDVRVQLASRMKTELVLKLEQSDGGKFQASFEVPGDGKLQEQVLALKDFKRADDSTSSAKGPDPSRVNQLVLMDIGGWFASKGENLLSLQQLSATGSNMPPAGAAADRRKPGKDDDDKPQVMAVATPGWSKWSKRVQPIYSGPYSLIGDPSVFKDGAVYRMFYTCFEHRRKGPAICQATSPDGLAWTDVPGKGPIPGLMIAARPGKWDDAHETAFAMKYKGQYLLYFVGYRDKGGFAKSFPAFLGLATSTDGINFERVSDEPILKPTRGWYDNDAVFSPSIVEHQGELVMIYTGHCWHDCPKGKGVFLLAATSKDGRTWVKKDRPIMDKSLLGKARDGAAESEIVKGPDGQFYLFMSLLYGDDKGHEIGVARAASPFGPWEIDPEAIVQRSPGQFDDVGPIAPSVLIENGKVRMWFHGFSKRKTIQIGYAEAEWPLRLPQ